MFDHTRRLFLGTLGVGVVPGLTQAISGTSNVGVLDAVTASTGQAEPQRASDYLLAPGLTYLNTASLGPTPRAVLNRTLEAWHELESNPHSPHATASSASSMALRRWGRSTSTSRRSAATRMRPPATNG